MFQLFRRYDAGLLKRSSVIGCNHTARHDYHLSKNDMTQQLATQDYSARYDQLLLQVRSESESESQLPSFDAMKTAVIEALDEETPIFDDFQAFFDWWDVTTAYDQYDSDERAEHHKPLLEVVFQALLIEGNVLTKRSAPSSSLS